MSHIQSVIDKQVMRITIARLDKKNALTLEMYHQLAVLLLSAKDDPEVSVVTLTGGPDCFSAGNDLHDFVSAGVLDDEHPVVNFLQVIATFDKPIIAGVAGYAVGIGTTMLLHCDLIYAAPDARFQLPFVQLGLCPEGASSYILPKIMGYHKAAELLLFGEMFDAQAALEFGLVNRIVHEFPIDQFIEQRALQLAQLPQASVLQTKRLLKGDKDSMLESMDNEIVEFGRLLHSDTCQQIIKKLLG